MLTSSLLDQQIEHFYRRKEGKLNASYVPGMTDKLAPSDRYKYIHEGRTIYEWDQTLSEVNIYIEVPAGVKAKQLFVDISSTHISLGIRPNPPYLDVSIFL